MIDMTPSEKFYSSTPLDSEQWLRVITATSEYESLLERGIAPKLEIFAERFSEVPREVLIEELRQLTHEFELSLTSTGHDQNPISSNGRIYNLSDRYRELEAIGCGGMGEIYRGLDQECSRFVAIKKLRQDHRLNPEAQARFHAEAEITAGLEHPGIVPVYGKGVDSQGLEFYAMRLISGDGSGTLSDSIQKLHQQFSTKDHRWRTTQLEQIRDLVRRLVTVCDTVAFAHSRGIVHRDLKPSNILIGPYGETLIADWGLARKLDPIDSLKSNPHPENQQGIDISTDEETAGARDATSGVGTPGYAAPELAQSPQTFLLQSADIYSLGAILLCMLHGRNPSMMAESTAVQWSNNTLASLEAIGRKAMDIDLSVRYPTVEDLRKDLLNCIAGEPVSAVPEGYWERAIRWPSRHRVAAAGLASAAVIAILAGSLILWLQTQQSRVLKRQATQLELSLLHSNALLRQTLQAKEKAQQLQTLAETRQREAIDSKAKAENQRSLAYDALLKFQELITSNQEIFHSPELARLNDSLQTQSRDILQFILNDLESEVSPSPGNLDRLSHATHRLATMESSLGRHDEANTIFDRSCQSMIGIQSDVQVPTDTRILLDYHIGRLRSLQGILSMRYGRNQQAKQQLEESIQRLDPFIHDESLGKMERIDATHASAGAMSALAMYHMFNGNVDLAKSMQDKAIESVSNPLPTNYEHAMMRVQIHGNMSLIYEQQKEPEKALEQLELAAKIVELSESMTSQKPGGVSLENQVVRPTSQYLELRTGIAHERARILQTKQEDRAAIVVLSELLQKQTHTLLHYPPDSAAIGSYQWTASRILSLQLDSGDHAPALELVENWQNLAQTLLDRSTPNEPLLLFLILAHHSAGHVLEQLGQRDAALERYRKALLVCEQTDLLKLVSAATCYQRVELEIHEFGLLLAGNQWGEAQVHFEQAFEAARKLWSISPTENRLNHLAKEQLRHGIAAMKAAQKQTEAAHWESELAKHP